MATAPITSISLTRDSGNDVINIIPTPAKPEYLYAYTNPNSETLYTDSGTLTTGMTLYDNTGTDTGLKVGTISGDSFDIQTDK